MSDPKTSPELERALLTIAKLPVPASPRLPRWIVAAACRLPSGAIVSLPRPARHHNVLHALAADGFKAIKISGDDQGFITNAGEYVDRTEGCLIARAANQIATKTGPADLLFSEDMW